MGGAADGDVGTGGAMRWRKVRTTPGWWAECPPYLLEPLAGEAEVDIWARARMHPAEGEIRCLPHHHARDVSGEDGPSDMVTPDIVNLACLDHGHDAALEPDIFADEGGGLGNVIVVVFRDAVSIEIMDRMDDLASRLGLFHEVLYLLLAGSTLY